jgi:iron(III) transport system substrate-binding protein
MKSSMTETRRHSAGQLWWLAPVLLGVGAAVFLAVLHPAGANGKSEVVAYCAQDQVYAEPLFREFEAKTGIRVRTVFDSEAVKTVGLANRLLAERSHAQCDVFWGNEEMRTRQLAEKGVFAETNGTAAFGFRSRRLVMNTNSVSPASAPRSLSELTNAAWRGKVALAYPQFGTTATHFHALRQAWGEEQWLTWCRALAANKPFLLDGNSMVVKMVARGEAWVGLSDSDDIADARREGLPVEALPLTGEMLLIPNTVGLVRNAPHDEAARRLFDFLQTPEVAQRLVAANALESASINTHSNDTLRVNWPALLRDLETTTTQLNEIFLR